MGSGGIKASSAFDVKKVDTKNLEQVGAYLTKYVTKNKAGFKESDIWFVGENTNNG